MDGLQSRLRQTRVRLTLAYSGIFLLLATVAATAFWFAFRQVEYASMDTSLASQARSLVAGLDTTGGRVTFNGNDSLPAETRQGIAIDALLVDRSGAVLDRSGPASRAGLPAELLAAAGQQGRLTQTTNRDGRAVRLLAQRVDLGAGRQAVLVLTRPTVEIQQALLEAALLLAGVTGALTLVASLLGYRLAGRALQPVRVIAATAEDISEHDLHRRITLDLPPDELGQLAETFNGMLARLESAFTTLQQFTADAAHELRAPLALIRTEMEVSRKRARSTEEYQSSQQTVLTEVERLSRLVDQLLILARDDAGSLAPAWTVVDLADLVEETVERWQPLGHRTATALTTVVQEEGSIEADPDLLRRLLDNLIDNAIRHAGPGGAVKVSVFLEDTVWKVSVSDSGPGVPPDLRAVVFERFTRADPARSRASGGAGLGLALCGAIARAHGGSVILTDVAELGGATFVVSLSRAPQAAAML